MAHGLNSVIKRGVASANCRNEGGKGVGSRRIFAPHFKLQVLDSYRNDADCKGNQRATARKYGIHRRQIQKWLQAENTLRNSVSNAKEKAITEPISEDNNNKKACNDFDVTLNGNGRQQDGSVRSASSASGLETALTTPNSPPVPYASSPPLDFTTRCHASPSVARSPPLVSPDPAAPIDLSFKRPTSSTVVPAYGAPACLAVSPLSSPEPQPDVWDLSTKNSKRKCCPQQQEQQPKPVKLFKPYLDDIKDEPEPEPVVVVPIKTEPCCPAAFPDTYFYNNNNNNNNNDPAAVYTLHELQPKSINYYYHHPYQVVECDAGSYCYEDLTYGQNMTHLKQRQSYSLDFKLSAIDCYYQDSICKGNQRAVATKYNVHRRQIQKWLKQAEELRLRNESMKQLHAVR